MKSPDPYKDLTDREREVLRLAGDGLTSKEIGKRLFLSEATINTHRLNLRRKLKLKNQTELVRLVLRFTPPLGGFSLSSHATA